MTFEPSYFKFPLYVTLLSLPFVFLYHRYTSRSPTTRPENKEPDSKEKTIMQPPKDDLAPPKDDPFTLEQLKEYDGSDTSKPIYVAIKGNVFIYSYGIVHF